MNQHRLYSYLFYKICRSFFKFGLKMTLTALLNPTCVGGKSDHNILLYLV